MRLLTRAAVGYRGPTVVMTVRVPEPVAAFVDGRVGHDGFESRSDVLQHAIGLWCLQEEARLGRNGSGP